MTSAMAAAPCVPMAATASNRRTWLRAREIVDVVFMSVSSWSAVGQARDGTPTAETNEPYVVLDADGRALFRGDRMLATKVQSNGEGIRIGSQTFKRTPLTIQSEGQGIKVGKKFYRHALKIWSDADHKVSIVNEINVEDYLRGVLPWEANPGWHEEALKAQAVASRTYALFRAIERKDQAFALSKTVKSQVYKGKDIENPKTDQAIERTRGEILTFKGKIFPAYFSSTCGGANGPMRRAWI